MYKEDEDGKYWGIENIEGEHSSKEAEIWWCEDLLKPIVQM